MKSSFLVRIRIASVFIVIVALAIIGKLYFVQIVNGQEYKDRAERQYTHSTERLFDRGSIFFEDKNGNTFTAATLKTGFTLSVNPKLLESPDDAYKKLSKLVTLDKADFTAKTSKKDDPYEELLKRLDGETAGKIEELKIPGVSIYKERWRYYPGEKLGSKIVGFVGYQGDVQNGRYGLENYYNDVLNRTGSGMYTNIFSDIFSSIKKVTGDDKLEGDIVATIEPNVQSFLEREVEQIMSKWQSDESGAVIIDPKTGDIYAMASSPSYDPNNFQLVKNPKLFSNPIVDSVYEMGSIIKPLTIASGIDAGTITAETTYYDKGTIEIRDKTISNFDGKSRGLVNMQEVLNQSLNTGVAYVADKLGKEKFSEYFLSLGLGEETGIDLPNEAPGWVSNLKKGGPVEMATASFGQGIAMTPIATIKALSALANEGVLTNPHIIKRIDYKVGFSRELQNTDEEQKKVFKKETTDEVTRMLVTVVDKALMGGAIKMKNYSVAAKTGTAQISNPRGGYYEDRYLHSFFGYFPAYNPKFLVFLYTVYPKGVDYASHTLTNPFANITKFLINYYEIPPDR